MADSSPGNVARRGARPVLWDLSEAGLAEVAAELEALGAEPLTARVDVGDPEEVSAAAKELLARVGTVDVLVNNAGVVSGKPLLELSPAEVERTFRVNALANYWTTMALLPAMIRSDRGHIVTVASAAGLVGVARQTDYSASKHAAVGFDESLRVELAHTAPGIRTTVVCPFYVDTGMFEGVQTRVPLLLPILREADVASRIVGAIEHDRARVVMPPMLYALPLLRLLPARAFDRVMDLFGVNVSMDHFKGRAGGEAAEPDTRPEPVP
ncbi:MAG: SDR family oxidoreductase [Microthrixaceae bacterium]|nr:SDR family oxidoreductase [Microthrixaceae bacterium]